MIELILKSIKMVKNNFLNLILFNNYGLIGIMMIIVNIKLVVNYCMVEVEMLKLCINVG